MAQTSVTGLVAGTTLAASDVLPFVDVSDTTQSASGSLLKITVTNFFATVPSPVIVTSTSTQLQLKYDGSNHVTVAVSSAGAVTLNATGASAGFTFSDPVTHSGTTTLSAALTYGGVTLSNAVTGTGNMVLSAGPTFTGVINLSGSATIVNALAISSVTLSATGNITTSGGSLVATTGGVKVGGTAPTAGAGEVGYGSDVQTTVGAAGGASALPAAPTGYLIVNIAGTDKVIPYYAAS